MPCRKRIASRSMPARGSTFSCVSWPSRRSNGLPGVCADADPLGWRGRAAGLIVSPRDWAEHVAYQGLLAQALRLRGAEVRFLTCGGGLEICDRANTYEAPPMPCRLCTRYVESTVDAHGFPRSSIRAGWDAADLGAWPEIDEVSIPELGAVTAEGLPLGQLVDIPLKWFLSAADPRTILLPGSRTGRSSALLAGSPAASNMPSTRTGRTWCSS